MKLDRTDEELLAIFSAEPFDFASTLEEETGAISEPDPDAIVIRTLVDQMRFDTTEFTVRAGETVKIWFSTR